MTPIFYDPLFIATSSLLIIQFLTYLLVHGRFIFHKPDCTLASGNLQGVSIIIAAQNEAENLQANLPAILEQNYTNFEVIVVNDQSEDETRAVVKDFQQHYNNLKLVNIEEHINKRAGKKFAITMGIKQASHEILLLTDADCRPRDKQWIHYMQRHYNKPNTAIVVGFSLYAFKSTTLNAFIQYDTFQTAFSYFGLGMAGMPYMGVGRNLSYRKSLFMENKGFAKYQHVTAGDDDLFVNSFGHKANVAFEVCPQGFTVSQPKAALKAWFRQKQRHLGVGKYYKKSHQLVLGGFWFLNLAVYALLAILLITYPASPYAWSALAVKIILFHIVTLPVLQKLAMMKLAPFAFLIDIIYQTVYMVLTGAYTTFKKQAKGWS